MKFHLFLQLSKMLFILLFCTIGIANSLPHRHKPRSAVREQKTSFYMENDKGYRSMDVDSGVPKKGADSDLKFMKDLKKLLNDSTIPMGLDGCPDCKKLFENQHEKWEAKPAYQCDRWDHKERTCWLDRNIGNSVTFVISLPPLERRGNISNVIWKQVFHTLHGNHKHFDIDPANPPWNIVVGSGGCELRLSPITEVDVDFNFFTAMVVAEGVHYMPERTIHYRIKAMPVDQGMVYPGASLMINMHSFVSLPEESMTFRWSLEKEPENTLPSNMRLSMTGAVLSISELRKEQEGIVVCSVYTNLGVFATQKRFLIMRVNLGNNLLVFEATRPPFNPQVRRRREIAQSEEDEEDESSNNKKSSEKDEGDNNDSEEAEQDNDSDTTDESKRVKGGKKKNGNSNHGSGNHNESKVPSRYAQEVKDIDDILAVEVKVPESESRLRVSDKLAQLMSTCHRSTECSTYAECNRLEHKKYGICRCLPRFEGTGVFCWELYKIKS